MKQVKMLGAAMLGVLVLAGAGCGSGAEESSAVTLAVPELGIEITTPEPWQYAVGQGQRTSFKTVAGGTPKITIEPVTEEEFPDTADELIALMEEAIDGFVLESSEDVANGFVLRFNVGDEESFTTIITAGDTSYICEPNVAAFTFEYDIHIEACESIRVAGV